MKLENLLKKVKNYVPFIQDDSRVEFNGKSNVPYYDSYIRTYRWCNGWREEGQLLLASNGDVVGDVIHVHTSATMGTDEWEEIESFPLGKATYILYYNVKFDTEEEEWASLYQISK